MTIAILNYINDIPDPLADINKKHELMDVIFLVFIKQHTRLKDSQASKRRRAAWSGEFRRKLIFD
ncbi:hypothetical protein [Photorhabdus viridis]|uniref:hypothetical protein n=1 Tax=Photorhabdus viridis TaxID=3163327 RepID=UPI003307841F